MIKKEFFKIIYFVENEKKTLVLQKDKTFLVNKETFTHPRTYIFPNRFKGLCQFVDIVDSYILRILYSN